MALIKKTVTCIHCKVDHEEYDATQYDDREKYLAYWNLPFEGEEADKAWQAKLNMTPKEAEILRIKVAKLCDWKDVRVRIGLVSGYPGERTVMGISRIKLRLLLHPSCGG
jgi:hypothetical protein